MPPSMQISLGGKLSQEGHGEGYQLVTQFKKKKKYVECPVSEQNSWPRAGLVWGSCLMVITTGWSPLRATVSITEALEPRTLLGLERLDSSLGHCLPGLACSATCFFRLSFLPGFQGRSTCLLKNLFFL